MELLSLPHFICVTKVKAIVILFIINIFSVLLLYYFCYIFTYSLFYCLALHLLVRLLSDLSHCYPNQSRVHCTATFLFINWVQKIIHKTTKHNIICEKRSCGSESVILVNLFCIFPWCVMLEMSHIIHRRQTQVNSYLQHVKIASEVLAFVLVTNKITHVTIKSQGARLVQIMSHL